MTKRKGSGLSADQEDSAGRVRRKLSGAARRALAEAEKRRAEQDADARKAVQQPKEFDGVDGPEPVRYGDWENKGRASDF